MKKKLNKNRKEYYESKGLGQGKTERQYKTAMKAVLYSYFALILVTLYLIYDTYL
tara:strand:+ start:400 stop:564 length:165 start_codon:yes stop_codon:yes gene_type:complete